MSTAQPFGTVHPDQQHRAWIKQFTWHLDCLPPIMDALVTATLPTIGVSRGGSRFDRPQVTGGGYIENVPMLNVDTDQAGHLIPTGAAADARELWAWITGFVTAVNDWIEPTRPAPNLGTHPNPDPLSARALALTAAGWLIDHADQVAPIRELDDHRDAMFALIRSLRGRYGVFPHPRTPRERCTTCGDRAVVVSWVDSPDGSPKPIRAGKCRTCGETYLQHDDQDHTISEGTDR